MKACYYRGVVVGLFLGSVLTVAGIAMGVVFGPEYNPVSFVVGLVAGYAVPRLFQPEEVS